MSGERTQKAPASGSLIDGIRDVIDTAVKFKKVMNKKRLSRARCVCPRCGKHIHGAISSYNGHFRMSCEGACGMAIME